MPSCRRVANGRLLAACCGAVACGDAVGGGGHMIVDITVSIPEGSNVSYDPTGLDFSSVPGIEAVLTGPTSVESLDVPSEPKDTGDFQISISKQCFAALSEADRDTLQKVIVDTMQEEMASADPSGLDVPAVPRMLDTHSAHVATDPRIMLQASVHFNDARSTLQSYLISSEVGAVMLAAAEKKIPGFKQVCPGPDALAVVGAMTPGLEPVPLVADDAAGSNILWITPLLMVTMGVAVAVAVKSGKLPSLPLGGGYSCIGIPKAGLDGKCRVDAIVVPGGGLMSSGIPPPWVEERLRQAAVLYEHLRKSQSQMPHIITHNSGNPMSSGRLSSRGPGSSSHIAEAEVCARFLREKCGVPSEAVWKETLSFTLVGNAYFCRTMFAECHKMRYIVLITNRFHMKFAKAVFTKIFSLPPLPHGRADWYALSFQEVTDTGLEQEDILALQEQEKIALQQFGSLEDRLTSLDSVHSLLLDMHAGICSRSSTR